MSRRVTRNSGRYRHNRDRALRSTIDLFESGLSKYATGTPAWPELPAEALQRFTA